MTGAIQDAPAMQAESPVGTDLAARGAGLCVADPTRVEEQTADGPVHDVTAILGLFATGQAREVRRSSLFTRRSVALPDGGSALRDDFPDGGGACCLFLRLAPGKVRSARFSVAGAMRLHSCAAGGWLLESADDTAPSYWLPQLPVLRRYDASGRILAERPAALTGLRVRPDGIAVALEAAEDCALDVTLWCIPAGSRGLCSELQDLCSLERIQPFLWSSKDRCESPADLYRYLVHGWVYQGTPTWPRKWKFCCELDACELYLWLSGLALATGKRLYGLLRRQIVLSVIARQADDGGWYHGEWTDLNECHYRFHNGALALLLNAADEWSDDVVRAALSSGAAFVAAGADTTKLGRWFLHDSLEASTELMNAMYRETGSLAKGFGAWSPSRVLGKSATNKLILNTHLDTTVVLDRYRQLTADDGYRRDVDSARAATRALLGLRPATLLYRAVYRVVGLTLLPASAAARLPLPVRALKRLAWMYLLPRLYRLKRMLPRIVMPDGFVDRHLSHVHFDANYHAVNVMDLVRHWRRFPEDDVGPVVDGAVRFAVRGDRSLLKWWGESKPRQFALVVFAEALYQLCMLSPEERYREHLAETLLLIDDLRLGSPPSILGGNGEIVPRADQVACPSPAGGRLRIANLCTRARAELLVVNPTNEELPLAWETSCPLPLNWTVGGAPDAAQVAAPLRVPPRGWLWGRDARGELTPVHATDRQPSATTVTHLPRP